jgi:chaperonin GroES
MGEERRMYMEINTLKPVGKKVIVRVNDLPDVTPGGIVIPQYAKDKHRAKDGIVVAVADTCELGIKIGQHVFFEDFAGSRIFIDRTDYLFVKEDALMMVIEED